MLFVVFTCLTYLRLSLEALVLLPYPTDSMISLSMFYFLVFGTSRTPTFLFAIAISIIQGHHTHQLLITGLIRTGRAILTFISIGILFMSFIFIGIISNVTAYTYFSVHIISMLYSGYLTLRFVDSLFSLIFQKQAICSTTIFTLDSFPVILALGVVELISNSFRSLSLGFRFSANAISGHILIHIF